MASKRVAMKYATMPTNTATVILANVKEVVHKVSANTLVLYVILISGKNNN